MSERASVSLSYPLYAHGVSDRESRSAGTRSVLSISSMVVMRVTTRAWARRGAIADSCYPMHSTHVHEVGSISLLVDPHTLDRHRLPPLSNTHFAVRAPCVRYTVCACTACLTGSACRAAASRAHRITRRISSAKRRSTRPTSSWYARRCERASGL